MNVNNSAEEFDIGTTACQWVKTKCMGICAFLGSAKFLISITTMASMISGLSLLTVGIAIIVMTAKYAAFFAISFLMLPIFVIVTASIVLCTTALGWYAVKGNKYNLFSAYLGLLAVILIFEILIAVLAFQLYGDVDKGKIINHVMFDSRLKYRKDPYFYYGADWDYLQNELQCCGYVDAYDWEPQVPLSCCPMSWIQSTFECTLSAAYVDGCEKKLSWLLSDYTFVFGITASTVAGVQGIIIVIATWIAYKLKNQQEIAYKGIVESTDHSQYHSVPGETN